MVTGEATFTGRLTDPGLTATVFTTLAAVGMFRAVAAAEEEGIF